MLIRVKVPLCCHGQPFLSPGYYTVRVTPRRLIILLIVLVIFVCLSPGGGVDRSVVDKVCRQVERGEAGGDICTELCSQQLEGLEHLPGTQGDKLVTFGAVLGKHGEVVVKSRTVDLDLETVGSLIVMDDDSNYKMPGLEEFSQMVSVHVSLNMNISVSPSDVLYRLWPVSLDRSKWDMSVRNIWTLAMDNEYVLSRLFSHYDVFPEMFGSCGGVYIVERLTPLNMPKYFEKISFKIWVDRVKVALAILDLVQELEHMFLSTFHLCDIKPEHFGVTEQLRVKYLDLDASFLKPVVDRTVGDGSDCSSHTDCHLFDCQGRCDLINGKCVGEVENNNLQVICEKLFLGKSLGFHFLGSSGLLNSRHASLKLKRSLKLCANPPGSRDGVRLAAGEDLFIQLYSALEEVVSIHKVLEMHN